MTHRTLILSAIALAFALGACYDERRYLEVGLPAGRDKTFIELNPVDDMHDQPYLKAQQTLRSPQMDEAHLGQGMLMPAPLAIPRDFAKYPAEIIADKNLAKNLHNPLPVTGATMLRGQDLFMTYCVVCHGERGHGDGTIIPKFPKPPSLASRKLRNELTDGDIFHIISQGQNTMPSYDNQLQPMERWAVVNYVRALQRAEYPKASDLQRLTQK